MIRYILLFFAMLVFNILPAQNWLDSLDNYARERISPPQTFLPGWQNAALLHSMELQYEMMPATEKQKYVDYVKIALDKNLPILTGLWPNPTSASNGLGFLYRVTQDPKYLQVAKRVYNQYLNILRTINGGVSHVPYAPELWDDTVYMVGVFLLSMYRATNDETYILELIDQVKKHKEKLVVDEWGLWVHGWDGNNTYNFDFCSQSDWANPTTRRSAEIWGRGNGWVVLTLSEILNNLPRNHPEWPIMANMLKDMIIHLPELQDANTGHWYQLTVRKGETGNYLESSSTAMFGYGILTALKYGIVEGDSFKNAMDLAYYGLRNNSVELVGDNDKPYLNTKNVALETCLGDKEYYYDIETGGDKAYASAVFVIFGRAYEIYKNGGVTGIQNIKNNQYAVQVYPTLAKTSTDLNIKLIAPKNETVQYVLIDMLGRIVQQQPQFLSFGENQNKFALNVAQGGQYIFIVKNQKAEIVKSFPIIIQ